MDPTKRDSLLRGLQSTATTTPRNSNIFIPGLNRSPGDANKRRRLSLLPPNTQLGQPRLLNSRLSKTPDVQDMVQRAAARNSISLHQHQLQQQQSKAGSRRTSQLPSSSSRRIHTPIDPRPLRDPEFSQQMQDELFDYLSNNNFNLEMNCSLTPKSVRNPTQKEFVLIFQFLYNKIDPGYRFLRSIEQEVYSLLKLLEYPYLETINKSQISAVGGSNWYIFLGMIHWMLKLVLQIENFDSDTTAAVSELAEDQKEQQQMIDKLFISYALKSYKSFLSFGEDDYSNYLYEMENDYTLYINQIRNKIDDISKSNEQLKDVLKITHDKHYEYKSQIERLKALENDVIKFKNYIDIQNQRKLKWPSILNKLNLDIEKIKLQISQSKMEYENILKDLNDKNFTLLEIEKMHRERALLTNDLNEIDQNQQNLKNLNESKLKALKDKFDDLNLLINNYNTKLYNISSQLDGSIDSFSASLILNPIPQDFISTKFGIQPTDLIPNLSSLKKSLNNIKNDISEKIASIQESIINSKDQLDDLELSLVSKNDLFDELNDRLKFIRKSYEELSLKHSKNSTTKQLEIEERDKEISSLKNQLVENVSNLDSKFNDVQKDIKVKSNKINENKNDLMVKLVSKLDSIISLKSDIINELDQSYEHIK